MSADPARKPHLRPVEVEPPLIVVNEATGERLGNLTDHTGRFEDEIAGLQRDIRGWAARYADLKRDRGAEAREHPLWPKTLEVFKYWQDVCKHPRSGFSLDRFEMMMPFVDKHGVDLCKRAIDGAAFDPFVTRRKNGSPKRHDGIDLIFRNADKFEEFCNRAPTPQPKGTDAPEPSKAAGQPRLGE